MKRNYLKQISFLLLLSLVVVFVSCKKERLTDPHVSQSQDKDMSLRTEAIVKRIKSFESNLNNIKRGVGDDTYIDVDSAMWNIEALFNSTFSMPDEKYEEKRIQELTFDIGVRRDNRLSMREVNVLYEDIIRSVKEAYINDGIDENKGLMSIIVDKEVGTTRSAKLKVTVVTGRTSTVKEPTMEVYFGGPFALDGCWYYGEFGGSCDDPFLLTDAAELLEDALNKYCGDTLPADEYKNIYVDLTMISLKGNEYKGADGDSYMFYKENCAPEELYLTGKELNEYYYWEKRIILNEVPSDSRFASVMPSDPSFIEVNIDGLSQMGGVNTIYYHHHDILYGTKCVVSRYVMGTTKNILNY